MTYLAKDGKVTGPFDDAQITQMKDSGDYYTYEWMWDGQSPDWYPVPRKLHTPPALPDEPEQTGPKIPPVPGAGAGSQTSAPAPAQPQVHSPAPAQAQPQPQAQTNVAAAGKIYPAIVFDNRQSIGGEVSHTHAGGAKFVSTPDAGSHFPKGAAVFVDLLNEKTDKSAKVKATIKSSSRMDSRWVFDLEWSSMPQL